MSKSRWFQYFQVEKEAWESDNDENLNQRNTIKDHT